MGLGGGSGGGLSLWSLSKHCQEERKAAASPGRCHKSSGTRLVGCSGHSKICCVVWSTCRQQGQTAEGVRLIRCLKVFREEQYPDRSWAKVVLAPLGRLVSSSLTSGAGPERTPFGLLLSIAVRTARVWIVFLATLMSSVTPRTNRSLT